MIKSYFDLKKKTVIPDFIEPGEELVRMFSASLDVGNRALSSWRLCNIYLTNKRLILAQARKIIKEFVFDRIGRVTIVERPWIANKKVSQLEIIMKSCKVYYVAVNDATSWLTEMAKLAGWNLDKSKAKPWKKKRGKVEIV
mgnify:CR=1 FL=1